MSILPYEKASRKWAATKAENARLSARLRTAAGSDTVLLRRAANMKDCAKRIGFSYCRECGNLQLASVYLCRDRLCLVCAWRLSLQRWAEMVRAMDYVMQNNEISYAAQLTLTVRNVPVEGLRDAIKNLTEAYHKLTRRQIWKKHIVGYARSIEVTYSPRTGCHPHMHIVVLFAPGYARDISQSAFAEAWGESLGVEYVPIVDIRRCYNRTPTGRKEWDSTLSALLEAQKYAIKPSSLKNLRGQKLAAFAHALTGIRMVGYGGIIKDARAALGIKTKDEAEATTAMMVECPKCASTEVVELAIEWSGLDYTPCDF